MVPLRLAGLIDGPIRRALAAKLTEAFWSGYRDGWLHASAAWLALALICLALLLIRWIRRRCSTTQP